MDFSDDEEVEDIINDIALEELLDTNEVVNVYKEDDNSAVIKHVINTCQTSSLHNRVAIRVKASNYEEMIMSFDHYIEKFNVFTQAEAVEMKTTFFNVIDNVNYKHYSILIPIFFIYAYCVTKHIAFPRSLKKKIAIEIYTKNICSQLMEATVKKFIEILGGKYRCNYEWSYYVKGFMLMVRTAAYNLGADSGLSHITDTDNLFLQNEYDIHSILADVGKKIKLESYRLLALGMIKHNCFNSSEFEHVFDLHIKTLLNLLEVKQILPKCIVDELQTRFVECPPNKKLGPHYILEEEIYANSDIKEINVLEKYNHTS